MALSRPPVVSLSRPFGPSLGESSGAPALPAPAGFSVGTTTSADFSLRFPASPFRAQGEISPGKNHDFPRTTAGSTPSCFGRESFAVTSPLALLDVASYPVSVRRLAISLPASFSAVLAGGRLAPLLRLAVRSRSLRPASPKDLHLLVGFMLGTLERSRLRRQLPDRGAMV